MYHKDSLWTRYRLEDIGQHRGERSELVNL